MTRRITIAVVGLAGLVIGAAIPIGVARIATATPPPPHDTGLVNVNGTIDRIELIQMPDPFPDVASVCSHGNRIYESEDPQGERNNSTISVVPDASCPGRWP